MSIEPLCDFCGNHTRPRCGSTQEADTCAFMKPKETPVFRPHGVLLEENAELTSKFDLLMEAYKKLYGTMVYIRDQRQTGAWDPVESWDLQDHAKRVLKTCHAPESFADFDDIGDTPEQRALVAENNAQYEGKLVSLDDGRPMNTDVFLSALMDAKEADVLDEHDVFQNIKHWVHGDWDRAMDGVR